MTRIRATLHAAILFLGIAGSMLPMGWLVFEETASLALYGTGVTAGAGYIAAGTYRSSRERS